MTPDEYERWNCTPYISSIAHQIEEVLPMAVAKPIWRVADNEGKVLGKIRGLMLLITLAALASAGLTVWSVMATTVIERRGEIAIMQATGAANWLVAALFAAEVALEGAAGGLIGSWVGLLLAAWVGRSVFQTSLEIPGHAGTRWWLPPRSSHRWPARLNRCAVRSRWSRPSCLREGRA